MRLILILCVLASLTGCYAAPPKWPRDRATLAHVELAGTRLYHRDVDPGAARLLLKDVEAVRAKVRDLLGCPPPRTELIIYSPAGSSGRSGRLVHETRADLLQDERGWVLGFVYPFRDHPTARSRLLETVAHEVAEATVLRQVRALDPYLRWMHDGLADLVEHEVSRGRDPAAARRAMIEAVDYLAARRAEGVRFADLSRWRQLPDWIMGSHLFLGLDADNLTLNAIEASEARVTAALAGDPSPAKRQGLIELGAILRLAKREVDRAWAIDEARPDDAESLGLTFYKLSFSFWLSIERRSPGTARRFVTSLAARRKVDPVLSRADAWAELKAAAGDVELPALSRFTLDSAEGILKEEERRLAKTIREAR